MLRKRIPNLSLLVIFIALLVLMTILNPQRFPTFGNLRSMAYQFPILGFLSLAMMMAMLSGGINLSIVATANFTGIVTAVTLRLLTNGATVEAGVGAILLAMLAGLLGALLVGLINGLLISVLEIPSILATLGMMTLLDGVNIVVTQGYTISGFPRMLTFIGNGRLLGVPFAFLLFVVLALILMKILGRTAFGFSLYMLGSNYTAAQYSNINNRSVVIREYLLSATFSAVTAYVMMGQLNSVKANYAESYLLVAVLACFLGGINPFGGKGTLSGLVISVAILQVIATGLNLFRVDPFFVRAMWGFIIIVVIAANHFGGVLRERRRLAEQSSQ